MTDTFREGRTAVIYARVSTKGQADSGASIETQLNICRKWCEHEGVTVVGEYHDDGVSGTTTDRDAFSSMFAAVYTKKPYYLVVYDSGRLTREGPAELETIKEIFMKLRVEIVYAGMGGIYASSMAATVADTYQSAADSLFVPQQKKKSRETTERLIASGKHVSQPVKFAFREDIPLMPTGRIREKDIEADVKDRDGRIRRVLRKATVVVSENDFFALVDRGATVDLLAEMWGVDRRIIMRAVKGEHNCKKEGCPLNSRFDEYERRRKLAFEKGMNDPFFEPYRESLRFKRAEHKRELRENRTSSSLDVHKCPDTAEKPADSDVHKGVGE